MSYIRQNTSINKKLFHLLFKLLNRIENNSNYHFNVNGEKNLFKNIINLYSNEIIVFDVGANKGDYTNTIIKLLDKEKKKYLIELFEPSTKAFYLLKENMKNINGISLNNVGISDVEGKYEIYFDEESSTLASLYKRDLKSEKININKKETITTLRLDTFIKNKNINKINLLKLDIEGHELSALRSLGDFLNNNYIDFIQFEYGGANLDSHTTLLDFYQLLIPLGFSLCKIKKKYLEKRDYIRRYDNFQYANYIAVSNNIIEKL